MNAPIPKQQSNQLRRRVGSRWSIIPLVLAACSLIAPAASAQFGTRTSETFDAARPNLTIPRSAPLENLFERAAEGRDRGDWKFAIDSLQRIIDANDSALLEHEGGRPPHGKRYESSRRRAMRALASLPFEGMQAYRLLYDGKAKRLYERAKASRDEATLYLIIDRFLLTSYGDDACDLLASWALDAGRPGEAVRALDTLFEFVPKFDVPRAPLAAKYAVALAMLGRVEAASIWLADASNEAYATAVASALPRSMTDDAWSRPAWFAELNARLLDLRDAHEVGVVEAGWDGLNGGRQRRGLMPAVEPTLIADGPWMVPLPDANGGFWNTAVLTDELADRSLLPQQMAIVDGRVFARTAKGVSAFDAEGMRRLWSAVPPPTEVAYDDADLDMRNVQRQVQIQLVGQVHDFDSDDDSPQVNPLFASEIKGRISTGHGLVFAIQQPNSGEFAFGDQKPWQVRLPFGRLTTSNDLYAFDQKTGALRWQHGMGSAPSKKLSSVIFRGVPLAVGEYLWVPYIRGEDLYVGVLDPRDGALVREVSLCTLGRSTRALNTALDLAYADGVVYVPSDRGALFAVNARDFSLRWAAVYQEAQPREWRNDDSSLFRSNPPVVAGDTVLLAPSDDEKLYAFSISDGAYRWSISGGPNWYVIAADTESVWLGGGVVTRVSLRDGSQRWVRGYHESPSARAVRSGSSIFAPTLGGLMVLDAASGEVQRMQALPRNQQALGTVVCYDGAMYSLNPISIRKFPDLAYAYPKARGRYAAAPQDADAAQRLAWLELIRGDAKRARAVLDGLPKSAFARDAPMAVDLSDVKVETLLLLAAHEGTPPHERLQLLREAQASSLTGEDLLRCGEAVGRALRDEGSLQEAYSTLATLAVSPAADQQLQDEHGVRAPARISVAQTLAEIAEDVPALQKRATDAGLLEQVSVAAAQLGLPPVESPGGLYRLATPNWMRTNTQAAAATVLARVASIPALRQVAQRAMFELGRWYAARQRYEAAEQRLRQAIALDADPQVTLHARVHLAHMYGQDGQALWGPQKELLDALVASDPDATLPRLPGPDSIASAVGGYASAPRGATGHPHGTVGAWAADRLAMLTAAELAPYRPMSQRGLAKIGERREHLVVEGATLRAPKLLQLMNADVPALATRAFVLGESDTVYCVDIPHRRIAWSAELEGIGQFRHPTVPVLIGTARFNPNQGSFEDRWAVADGQVLVVRTERRLFGIGMVTGRRLWDRPREARPLGDLPQDFAVGAGGGYVAAELNRGRLELLRSSDGQTVWEYDLRGANASVVEILGDRVLFGDGKLERIYLLDVQSGKLIKQVLFQQHDEDSRVQDVVSNDGRIVGPMVEGDQESIAAYSLETGEKLWQYKLDLPLMGILKPTDDTVAASTLHGGLLVFEDNSGEPTRIFKPQNVAAVMAAAFANGVAVMQYAAKDDEHYGLVALDYQTGKELWRKEGLAELYDFNRRFRIHGMCIPVLLGDPKQGIVAHMISLRTGEALDKGAQVVAHASGSNLRGRPAFWHDGALFTLGSGAMVVQEIVHDDVQASP